MKDRTTFDPAAQQQILPKGQCESSTGLPWGQTSWPETTLSQSDIRYLTASTFLALPCAAIYPMRKINRLLRESSRESQQDTFLWRISIICQHTSASVQQRAGDKPHRAKEGTERGTGVGREQALAYLPVISWLRDGVQMGWM